MGAGALKLRMSAGFGCFAASGRSRWEAAYMHGDMLWPPDTLTITIEDPELAQVEQWFSRQGNLVARFGWAIRTALDEVIDTARTARWSIDQCNDQEKAYVGVKV